MYRFLERVKTKKASIFIKLQNKEAVVTYSIDPQYKQKGELRYNLNDSDFIPGLVQFFKKQVNLNPNCHYDLTIEINSLGRKDKTERGELGSQETSQMIDTFISTNLKQHVDTYLIKIESKSSCAIL